MPDRRHDMPAVERTERTVMYLVGIDEHPAEIGVGVIEPALHVAHHRCSGVPRVEGVERRAGHNNAGAGRRGEIAAWGGPRHRRRGREEAGVPGDIAFAGRGALSAAYVVVGRNLLLGGPLAPVRQQLVESDRHRLGQAACPPAQDQVELDALDDGAGWNAAGDVKGDQGASRGTHGVRAGKEAVAAATAVVHVVLEDHCISARADGYGRCLGTGGDSPGGGRGGLQ